jgi:hypothetical protein
MLKAICYNGWFVVLISFILGTISIRDYLEFTIGSYEYSLLLLLFCFCSIVNSILQFSKEMSKYFIAFNILFCAALFFILGYSSFPERQLERARDYYYEVEDFDYSLIKKDNRYASRVDHIRREQRARKLELEAAELRYYGPSEFYRFSIGQYILFFSAIVFLIAYAICWFTYLSNSNED